jgi:hypothetical protein
MRLREDYTQNQIFTTGFWVLVGIGCGNILADNFFSDWWFLAGLVGGVLGLLAGIRRFRLRFFETLEAFVISGLFLFLSVALAELISDYSLSSLSLTSGVIFFIAAFLFLDAHYKKFTWYKSGRVGFSGLTILGLFFLTRSIVAMSDLSVLSFVGDFEVVISGILSFASFMAVYNLSEKT